MRLHGEVTPPGDKSISHRVLMLGALADGESRLRGLNPGADVAATAAALRQLGVDVRDSSNVCVVVGRGGKFESASEDVECGNSGTTMRLLTGLLAGCPGIEARLVGDDSLSERPMERVARPLRLLGANVTTTSGRPPVLVQGSALTGSSISTEVASAQVKSAVLLAALQASGPTVIAEPAASRDHTERLLKRMGAVIETGSGTVRLSPGLALRPLDLRVPGDPSAAAFYVVAACLAEGSDIVVRGVGVNPTRIGFIEVLRRMGAQIAVSNERDEAGEPVADIHVSSRPLRATAIEPGEIPSLVDEVPILSVAAAGATGVTTIRGAAELRLKESDRLRAVADGLGRLGIGVTETEDGLDIVGSGAGAIGEREGTIDIDGGGDHRMAMSFRVLDLVARADVRVGGDGAAVVSDPDFDETLSRLVVG